MVPGAVAPGTATTGDWPRSYLVFSGLRDVAIRGRVVRYDRLGSGTVAPESMRTFDNTSSSDSW